VATKRTKRRESNAIQRFSQETVGELRKVSWPTRSQAIGLTKVVIIVMVIMGAILGGLDLVFFRFFAWLLG
jgi:preprotein translocase subunit SecE